MGHNFHPVEREQAFLLPVSMRDWLPADDLVWFVIDAVEQLDLAPLRSRYRVDGRGGAAYDPAMMTALLLYAYATGERSSRAIERLCRRDIGFRVISGNRQPDHATIARFRVAHEAALAGLFGEVLRLCAGAGLGRLGLIALDGTRLAGNASMGADRDAAAIDAEVARILAEAAVTDAAEDAAQAGPDDPGGALPAGLADRGSRLARLREARRRLDEVEAERAAELEAAEARHAAGGARRGPAPRADAVRRRRFLQRNTTDPDARRMRAAHGWVTGYNAQAVVTEDGVVIAADVSASPADRPLLATMLAQASANVRAARLPGRMRVLLADGGYGGEPNLALEGRRTPRFLIPEPGGRTRSATSTRPRQPLTERMRRRLSRAPDRRRYARRKVIVEPLFGHVKENLGFRRFSRRGLSACTGEWRFLCAAVNLVRLWRHGPTRATAPLTTS